MQIFSKQILKWLHTREINSSPEAYGMSHFGRDKAWVVYGKSNWTQDHFRQSFHLILTSCFFRSVGFTRLVFCLQSSLHWLKRFKEVWALMWNACDEEGQPWEQEGDQTYNLTLLRMLRCRTVPWMLELSVFQRRMVLSEEQVMKEPGGRHDWLLSFTSGYT